MREERYKHLIVYKGESYYKFYEIFKRHLYKIEENNNLVIYERNRFSGEEEIKAYFKEWDYFFIEEE